MLPSTVQWILLVVLNKNAYKTQPSDSRMSCTTTRSISSRQTGNKVDLSSLCSEFQQQGMVDVVGSRANKLNGACRIVSQWTFSIWNNDEIILIQRRCIPGLMYRFFMAHSSRMDANFLNGAPEFNNVSNKSRISGMTIEHICFKSRKQTFKLNHGLLDHRFELAYTWKFETLEKETLYHN